MSIEQEDAAERHLVIIRGRRASAEDGHHGGAWKIAYADFMTAMMAFFLVMWLINMSDDKTITQIAAYFNPMKLSDKSRSKKGLSDGTMPQDGLDEPGKAELKEKSRKTIGASARKSSNKETKEKTGPASRFEDELIVAPNEVLDRIEGRLQSDYIQPEPERGKTGANRTDATPSTDSFELRIESGSEPGRPGVAGDLDGSSESGATVGRHALPQLSQSAVRVGRSDQERKQDEQVRKLREELDSLLVRLQGKHPAISIEATSDGVLISLMDNHGFGMFASGSAEPRPETVALMGEVGKLLAAQPNAIIIRGHTDSRQYRDGNYDNWRLSAARANSARHMLVRGGLESARIIRIEGYADRTPRVTGDTLAPANRRIDILAKFDR